MLFKESEAQLPNLYLECVLILNFSHLGSPNAAICACKQLQLQLIAHKIRGNLRKEKKKSNFKNSKSFVQKCFHALDQVLLASFCCVQSLNQVLTEHSLLQRRCTSLLPDLLVKCILYNEALITYITNRSNAVVSFGRKQRLCGQLKACLKAICDPLHAILMLM